MLSNNLKEAGPPTHMVIQCSFIHPKGFLNYDGYTID